MKSNHTIPKNRRAFLQAAGAAAATLALGSLPLSALAQSSAAGKMKIGIIGSGRVGGAVGGAWVKAGHEVMFSSLNLEEDKKLAASLGGGAGLPAFTLVAKAQPDGYTILVSASNLASNPILFKKLPYDAEKDFAPISLIAIVPAVLVVHPGSPLHSAKDLIALAKVKPGALNYGSVGNGSGNHLVTEMFANAAGLQLSHVPYKSAGAFMTDLVSGRLDFVFATIPAAHAFISSGRVRALGVSSLKRSSTLADVPSIAESAIPGFEVNTWLGALAPAGTPPKVVARLNTAILEALRTPGMGERLKTLGAEPVGSGPAQMGTYLTSEIARWTNLAKTVKFEVSN